MIAVQRAVAVRDDHVPSPARDFVELLLEMVVERRAAPGLEVHVVGEPRLVRKGLEEGRNAPDVIVVQIRDRVGPPEPDGRARAEGEAVSDEEDGLPLLRLRAPHRQGHQAHGKPPTKRNK